jgi:hypothetical protein
MGANPIPATKNMPESHSQVDCRRLVSVFLKGHVGSNPTSGTKYNASVVELVKCINNTYTNLERIMYNKPTPIETNTLCENGCGNIAQFKLRSGKLICKSSSNKCPVNIKKNSDSLKLAYKEGRKDCAHFDGKRGWSKGKTLLDLEEVFTENSHKSNDVVKNALLNNSLKEYKCEVCSLIEWQGKPVKLHLDHINGINTDNRIDNLRFLCPNCHSQTDTYCGKSINTGKLKVSDEFLIECVKSSRNVRQALIKSGLTPKGLNYERVYKLMNENNLSFLAE